MGKYSQDSLQRQIDLLTANAPPFDFHVKPAMRHCNVKECQHYRQSRGSIGYSCHRSSKETVEVDRDQECVYELPPRPSS